MLNPKWFVGKKIKAFVILMGILIMGRRAFSATYYVSKQGNDKDTGTTWSLSYLTIKRAVSAAKSGDSIWVAEGTYIEGRTIYLYSGRSLYGGFKGGENNLSERDFSNNKTIIDMNNSYYSIYNYGIIDGLYITKRKTQYGSALYNEGTVTNCTVYSNSSQSRGGGIYNKGAVINCTVSSNSAYKGGGIYNEGVVANCKVYSNSATESGGIFNMGVVTNCEIYSNWAKNIGGGIYNYQGTVTNCTVYSNTAYEGGGICNNGIVANSEVYSNSAEYGGGISNSYGAVTNSVVYSNSAKKYGGGVNHFNGTLTNCTIYSNSAELWGGVNNHGKTANCIVWNNSVLDISRDSSIAYSCFGESDGSNNNINSDPLFINVSGDNSTWDFNLQNNSPCIDAGNPAEEYYDGCLPPGKGTSRNDMGAFGGLYNCAWIVVPTPELQEMILNYLLGNIDLTPQQKSTADLNHDGKIDIADLVLFQIICKLTDASAVY